LDESTVYQDIQVRFLGSGVSLEKPSIDHRINCVGSATLFTENHTTGQDEVLVVSGDSNGSCYLYRFSERLNYGSPSVQLLYRDERPILSLDLIHVGRRYLLLLGGTGGCVRIFDLPDTAEETAWLRLDNAPLVCYDAHSMGTNAIASFFITDSDGRCVLRICSGGDDQAICCCNVSVEAIDPNAPAVVSILQLNRAKEAALSAIKGVAFIDREHFVLAGYDQRLAVWSCNDGLLADEAVDIGDINCLATCFRPDQGDFLVAVGGAGVECLSIKVP
jgi:WD40 repeat protein